MIKSKRTQSETVGFVIIILIVMILGVIMLGISLRTKSKPVLTIDSELSNFLISSADYTTECYKDSEADYKKLSEVVRYCYDGTQVTCPGGEMPCDYIKDVYANMTSRFRPAGQISYYDVTFIFNNSAVNRPFQDVSWGTLAGCSNKRAGQNFINAGDGNIIVQLQICFSG